MVGGEGQDDFVHLERYAIDRPDVYICGRVSERTVVEGCHESKRQGELSSGCVPVKLEEDQPQSSASDQVGTHSHHNWVSFPRTDCHLRD